MKLDTFTTAYIEAALWSSADNAGVSLDHNYSINDTLTQDISSECLNQMIADCAKFQADNADDIGDRDDSAGRDFWLTRNGHGAGFWDGDWPKEIGERLTAASKAYGEVDLYVGDDGLIYC